MSDPDCLCGGSGTIYDFSSSGDPCPQCDGSPFSAEGQRNYERQVAAGETGGMASFRVKGGGCVVVGVALAGGMGAVLYGVAEVVRGIV